MAERHIELNLQITRNAQTALFARAIAYPSESLLAAFRCWRQARDSGAAVQPSLLAVLSPQGCEILAPVFDTPDAASCRAEQIRPI